VSLEVIPSSCPEADYGAMVRSVRERSDRIEFSDDSGETPRLQTTIRRPPSGPHLATLTVVRADGTSSTRTIEATTCEEAIDALALILVVTFDPSALARSVEYKTPTPSPQKTQPSPLGARRSPAGPPPEHNPRPSPVLRLVLGPEFLRGPTPGWMWGGAVGLDVDLKRGGGGSPLFRITADHLRHRHEASGGVAHFALTSVRLEACPVGIDVSTFALLPCICARAGVMATRGSEINQPRASTRSWWSLGPSAMVALRLGQQWSLIADADLQFALVRDRYEFAPQPFYETTPTTLGLVVGVGKSFP
jgi:hypothetical protein